MWPSTWLLEVHLHPPVTTAPRPRQRLRQGAKCWRDWKEKGTQLRSNERFPGILAFEKELGPNEHRTVPGQTSASSHLKTTCSLLMAAQNTKALKAPELYTKKGLEWYFMSCIFYHHKKPTCSLPLLCPPLLETPPVRAPHLSRPHYVPSPLFNTGPLGQLPPSSTLSSPALHTRPSPSS